MPRVRIVLEDDNGNPLPETEQVYPLENACDTLNQIEAIVKSDARGITLRYSRQCVGE